VLVLGSRGVTMDWAKLMEWSERYDHSFAPETITLGIDDVLSLRHDVKLLIHAARVDGRIQENTGTGTLHATAGKIRGERDARLAEGIRKAEIIRKTVGEIVEAQEAQPVPVLMPLPDVHYAPDLDLQEPRCVMRCAELGTHKDCPVCM
jgi:hypothetical protein